MNAENPIRLAKLFKTGGSQAVRLPAEFRFDCKQVRVRRDVMTGEVILSPILDPDQRKDSWRAFNEGLERAQAAFPEEFGHFMDERPLNQPLSIGNRFMDND
jgi:antitoxin VapB